VKGEVEGQKCKRGNRRKMEEILNEIRMGKER
jgi:hypothetical protein